MFWAGLPCFSKMIVLQATMEYWLSITPGTHPPSPSLQLESDRLSAELSASRRECEQEEQRYRKLREVCTELEAQTTDYEAIIAAYDARDSAWKQEK
jgi:hypothetical protein